MHIKSINLIEYQVIDRIVENHSTVTLVLKPSLPLTYRAGQFITFVFDHLATHEIRRSYSISSSPSTQPEMQITVQRITNGLVSRFLVNEVEVGDKLTGLKPTGQFVLPEQIKDVVLIGGGSGVTPILSLTKELLAIHQTARAFLILSFSTMNDILFLDEWKRLSAEYDDRLSMRLIISQLDELPVQNENLIWIHSRASNALYEKWISNDLKSDVDHKAHFFLCGPAGLMIKAKPVIRFLGYEPEQVHLENFVITEPFHPPLDDLRPASLKLIHQGVQTEIKITAGQTVLEAALQAGIILPYNCRSGICSACSGTCLEGVAKMYGADTIIDTEQTKGEVLTCVAYPLTEALKIKVL